MIKDHSTKTLHRLLFLYPVLDRIIHTTTFDRPVVGTVDGTKDNSSIGPP